MYTLIRPLLFSINPELAHNLAVFTIKKGAMNLYKTDIDEKLKVNVAGIDFQSPIGLAAGFDKDAEFFNEMYKIGFGYVETGTVTPRPQYGNPKPRIFRLEKDLALINKLGFNNVGLDSYVSNIVNNKDLDSKYKIGANIGPNKDSEDKIIDYLKGIKGVSKIVDYITVNISSPNTPNLRDFESKNITNLLKEIKLNRVNNVPIFIKISPDITNQNISFIIEELIKYEFNGLIISNTTKERSLTLKTKDLDLEGGLSGKPLLDLSNKKLSFAYNVAGNSIPIIGVGGISCAADVYKKIKLGASLVQLYTSLIYWGPSLINKINNDLLDLMELDGVSSLSEVLGASKLKI